jgi:subtilisin family serine protease
MSRAGRATQRIRAPWIVAAGLLITAPAASGAGMPPGTTARTIDARLLPAVAAGESVRVWVEFADKGARDRADLARRLARAEAALTPRARARRERAGVAPLVDERDLPVEPAYLEALRERGLRPFAVSRWFNRAALETAGGRLADLAALGFVSRIAPVERGWLSARPTPPGDEFHPPPRAALARGVGRSEVAGAVDYGLSLDQLSQIGVPAVHDSGYIGTGVLVCMLDDGARFQDQHASTRGIHIPPGHRRDFVDGDTLLTDAGSGVHGLYTLACVGANRPGQLVGPAFGATFALARTEVDASETTVEMLYWAQGAEWADSLGADVISSSLGYRQFDGAAGDFTYADMDGHTTEVTRAAEIAASKGILVVNSVGNEGDRPWHYLIAPADASGDSLIAVGAVDAAGRVAGFSSFGPTADGRIKPDLVARGVDDPVPGIADSNAYSVNSGTSLSAPIVAGLAACLMQARPTWTPGQVIRALRETASRICSPDNAYGYGLPNGPAALRWAPDAPGVPVCSRSLLGIRLIGPNPLRAGGPPARVRFALGTEATGPVRARLRVVDVTGRIWRELWSGTLLRGESQPAAWDGLDRRGRRVPAGLYWLVLEGGGSLASVRLVSL